MKTAHDYSKLGDAWIRDPSRRLEAILAYEAALKVDPACEPAKDALAAARGRAPTPQELAAADPFVDWYAYDRGRIAQRMLDYAAKKDDRARVLYDLSRAAGIAVDPPEPPKPAPPPPKPVLAFDRMTEQQRKQEREILAAWVAAWRQGTGDHRDAFMELGKLWKQTGDRARAILAFATVDTDESRRELAAMFEVPEPSLVPGEIHPVKDWTGFVATVNGLDRGALFRAFMCLAHADQKPSAITAWNGRARGVASILARDYLKEGDKQKALSFLEMLAVVGSDEMIAREVASLRGDCGL